MVRRTIDEWEAAVGQQVRELRDRAGLTQSELARRADVSIGAVQGLEYGSGSRLATLISVLRALGRASWLEQLAPPVTVSPMQLLAEQERSSAPRPGRPRPPVAPPGGDRGAPT
jgi:transcriptional regulator with XRE-family HTH domain